MECYRKCNNECNEYKRIYCIYFMDKTEYEFRQGIREHEYCKVCHEQLIDAVYQGMEIKLCTNCNNVLRSLLDGYVREEGGKWIFAGSQTKIVRNVSWSRGKRSSKKLRKYARAVKS